MIEEDGKHRFLTCPIVKDICVVVSQLWASLIGNFLWPILICGFLLALCPPYFIGCICQDSNSWHDHVIIECHVLTTHLAYNYIYIYFHCRHHVHNFSLVLFTLGTCMHTYYLHALLYHMRAIGMHATLYK